MPPATATRKKTVRRTARRDKRQPIQAEDVTRLIGVATPCIAPDASAIVFTRAHVGEKPSETVRNLWMVETDGETPPQQFTAGGRDGQPRFSPDGSQIAFVRSADKTKPQIYVLPRDGGEARPLTSFGEGSIGAFKWSPTGRHIAIAYRRRDPDRTEEAKKTREREGLSDPPMIVDHWWYRLDGDGFFGGDRYRLYLVDVETGQAKVLYSKDTLGGFSFDFAPNGRELVVATNRDRRAGLGPWRDDLLRVDVTTGKVTVIPGLPEGPKSAPIWSPDGSLIAFAGREGEDDVYSPENLDLWVCEPGRGRPRCLTDRHDYCLMAAALTDTSEVEFGAGIRWAADSKRVFMQIGWHGESHLASVRTDGSRLTFHTEGVALHAIGNLSEDGKTMAMTVTSPARPDEVAVVDLRRREAEVDLLTDFNGPLLAERLVAKPREHWVQTADGTEVQVWVMLPPAPPKGRRLPAVLEIHGGPHAQYGLGFFHEFQMLASAGYAVFFSNPRGSKGYGRDHCAAIRGSWGKADWVDVQAVTEFIKSHPLVDPKRLAVMGGSYGGYMTNWVIGNTNDFAAAITDRCVSNLVSMSGNSDYIDVPDMYWEGNGFDRPEARWEGSPIRHLGKCRTPTLIIHSEGDLRCNIEQAEQVFSVLTLRGVPTRFVRYPRSTSHGFSRCGPPDLRVHRLDQIREWLDKYLKK